MRSSEFGGVVVCPAAGASCLRLWVALPAVCRHLSSRLSRLTIGCHHQSSRLRRLTNRCRHRSLQLSRLPTATDGSTWHSRDLTSRSCDLTNARQAVGRRRREVRSSRLCRLSTQLRTSPRHMCHLTTHMCDLTTHTCDLTKTDHFRGIHRPDLTCDVSRWRRELDRSCGCARRYAPHPRPLTSCKGSTATDSATIGNCLLQRVVARPRCVRHVRDSTQGTRDPRGRMRRRRAGASAQRCRPLRENHRKHDVRREDAPIVVATLRHDDRVRMSAE